ncbi:SEC14 cytosolic factor family protein [Actinidia rufa]|uniref:SEC14 cytosolic factor family protein n=1 Tax=Actinidia rufa TaxID=165716 RepID=A0A7J0D812_9ERIC|nr:SEC14 cytosolic factor family protein [Actinidia rufa]
MADEAKAKGNASFTAGNYTDTIHHFTEKISLAPDDHVLYSNRSAAQASVRKFAEASSDAEKAVELKPDWPKGYYCVGTAHMWLRRYDDAASAYKNGLEIVPNNEALKSGLFCLSGLVMMPLKVFPDRQWSKYLDEYEILKITVLMDCEVFSPFRFPMQMMRSCAMLLQDHYPNYLGFGYFNAGLPHPPIISKSTSFELNDEMRMKVSCLLMIVKRKDDSCWNEFSVQSRFTSQEFGEWMSIPMLWHYVFVEIDPLIFPVSFFKAVFWHYLV